MIYLLDLENVSNQKPMLMQSGSTLEQCQFLRLVNSYVSFDGLVKLYFSFDCIYFWGMILYINIVISFRSFNILVDSPY